MRFKTGENLPIEVARLLQEAGHDACTVTDQQMEGGPDHQIAAVCRQEGRALVTLDTTSQTFAPTRLTTTPA